MAKLKLKSLKWFTLIGAMINICFLAVFFVQFFQAITHYEEIASSQGGFTEVQYEIYSAYYVLIYIASISMVFSLLLISMSVRIDQIYYRLKWVNITTSILSLITILGTSLIASKYPQYEIVKMFNPIIIYIILIVVILLLIIDQIILYIKYKNNPFYHGGAFKKSSNGYHRPEHQKKTDDGYINPTQRPNEKVVDEKDVIDNDLSYFEIYERRSAELKALDELYENNKITEEEYYKRRKEIYVKYDNKYN